jgi:3-phenylpropionate/trans-cinnamate dioxygenase ferredoxin subunit
MPAKTRVCSLDDVPVGAARRVEVGGVAIALVHCTGGYRAVADTCSHEDYSLAEGEVYPDECEIECWKHGSTFSLETGLPLTLPATQPVKVFEVVVEGDDVFVVAP